jgi:hypothetical protein
VRPSGHRPNNNRPLTAAAATACEQQQEPQQPEQSQQLLSSLGPFPAKVQRLRKNKSEASCYRQEETDSWIAHVKNDRARLRQLVRDPL